jgi:hypothetical protein
MKEFSDKSSTICLKFDGASVQLGSVHAVDFRFFLFLENKTHAKKSGTYVKKPKEVVYWSRYHGVIERPEKPKKVHNRGKNSSIKLQQQFISDF